MSLRDFLQRLRAPFADGAAGASHGPSGNDFDQESADMTAERRSPLPLDVPGRHIEQTDQPVTPDGTGGSGP